MLLSQYVSKQVKTVWLYINLLGNLLRNKQIFPTNICLHNNVSYISQVLIPLWLIELEIKTISFCVWHFRLGSILGLGVCVSAMCADGKMDSKVHVRSIREQLSAAQDMCDVTESTYEVSFFMAQVMRDVTESTYKVRSLWHMTCVMSWNLPMMWGLYDTRNVWCHGIYLWGKLSMAQDMCDVT